MSDFSRVYCKLSIFRLHNSLLYHVMTTIWEIKPTLLEKLLLFPGLPPISPVFPELPPYLSDIFPDCLLPFRLSMTLALLHPGLLCPWHSRILTFCDCGILQLHFSWLLGHFTQFQHHGSSGTPTVPIQLHFSCLREHFTQF